MGFFELSENAAALSALTIVIIMFLLFLRESYPTEVVAIAGVAVMLLLGVLPYEAGLQMLANPAPWTIAAMFIIMGALVRTGALNAFTDMVERHAGDRPHVAIATLLAFVILASAVVSNTPVVVMMIPVFMQLSRTFDIAASKLLIPLSYAAILGGTLTLIGTSTNLLVDGVARSEGLKGFTIFEVTPLAIILVIWGAIYLRLVVPYLLPERDSLANLLTDRSKKKFFAEFVIPPDSNLIGSLVTAADLFQRQGVRVIDVVRGDESLRRNLGEVQLQPADRVIIRTHLAEFLSLQRDKSLRRVDQVSTVETSTVEVLVTPGCNIVGRTLGSLRLRRHFGVYVLAVHRRNQNFGRQLDDLTVKVGDTLLLEGAVRDIHRLAVETDMVEISQTSEREYRRGRAPIALVALFAVVILAALEIAPIFLLAVVAVTLVLITRCIDADEAFSFIDGRLLTLIFAMLAIGAALQSSGAVRLIVEFLAPKLQLMPPFFILWSVYLLTSILTELVSNNAVAVVVTPIAISLAYALGFDPRPFVIAVMVAASASFATPIGYQTNMLVYGPGGYHFKDFLKLGIPLNLTIGLLACLLIPFFWPL
ncbi:MAG: SLC13 family permease [Aestuariivita sp.]|nr:SLC13 family permease [Aestuariivita sp.]MCY4347148.1 SLC13 family permease [Aestuariivita sp.]